MLPDIRIVIVYCDHGLPRWGVGWRGGYFCGWAAAVEPDALRRPWANLPASKIASTMLRGFAVPVPAMSKAVP